LNIRHQTVKAFIIIFAITSGEDSYLASIWKSSIPPFRNPTVSSIVTVIQHIFVHYLVDLLTPSASIEQATQTADQSTLVLQVLRAVLIGDVLVRANSLNLWCISGEPAFTWDTSILQKDRGSSIVFSFKVSFEQLFILCTQSWNCENMVEEIVA